jgi:hypothetical protein
MQEWRNGCQFDDSNYYQDNTNEWENNNNSQKAADRIGDVFTVNFDLQEQSSQYLEHDADDCHE